MTASENEFVISICLATYQRPTQLKQLLKALNQQSYKANEIVIVDNDAQGSANSVVQAFLNEYPDAIPIHYSIQAEKNIALTRNQTIELAKGPWLAFIDDDETPENNWLETLINCAETYQAEALLAPVIPLVPESAPAWIRKGQLYECPRMPSGTAVPLNRMRIGNALIKKQVLNQLPQLFDPDFGLTGGSDSDLLIRLVLSGVPVIWCDEAIVSEPVAANRLQLAWILRRGMRGGQDYARHFLNGRFTQEKSPSKLQRFVFFGRAAAQMVVAAILTPLSLPFGRHHAAYWLSKCWANFGKLAVLSGWHYREYA